MDIKLPNLSVKIINPKDIDGIITFLMNYKNEKRDKQYWKRRFNYWWKKNPSFDSNSIRGAILVDNDNNNIVGFFGAMPLGIMLNGEAVLSYALTLWKVDQRYRSHSIKLLFYLLKTLDGSVLFNNTSNPEVYSILLKLKFDPIYKRNNKTHFIFKKFFFEKMFKNTLFSTIKILGFRIIDTYQKKFIFNHKIRHSIKRIDNIDDFYNQAILETNDEYDLTIRRSLQLLSWLKKYNGNDRVIILGNLKSDLLTAYCIFIVIPTIFRDKEYNRLVCIDIWGDLYPDLLKGFLFHISKEVNKEEIDIIEIPEFNTTIKSILNELKLFRRKWKDRRLIKIDRDKYKLNVENDKNIYCTMLEGDYSM